MSTEKMSTMELGFSSGPFRQVFHGHENVHEVDGPSSCDSCGSGTQVIPIGGEWELAWPKPVRAILYFVALGWCFLGIAIVCDQFMAAIEELTHLFCVVARACFFC